MFYSGIADGKHGLYSVPADASAKPTLILSTESSATPRSITPDGRTLVYVEAGPDKRPRLLVLPIPIDGQPGQPRPLHADAAGAETDAQLSPDGRWIAYESNESGTTRGLRSAISWTGAEDSDFAGRRQHATVVQGWPGVVLLGPRTDREADGRRRRHQSGISRRDAP